MSGASGLRALLRGEAMVIAPGAYDGLTAKLVAQAGFPAVYMTGAGTSVSHGYPDFGLLTMSEMVENAARIVRSVDVPVIADADTGYGNELNVFRTVQEYEQRGVAGDPHRGPGVAEEMRPSRRQGDRVARGLHREDPCRGRGKAERRLHDHRADRCTRRRGPGRGGGARQCGAGCRRRHGVRRGAADDGRARGGAEARARARAC